MLSMKIRKMETTDVLDIISTWWLKGYHRHNTNHRKVTQEKKRKKKGNKVRKVNRRKVIIGRKLIPYGGGLLARRGVCYT